MAVDTYKDSAHGVWIGYQPVAGTFTTPTTPMAWVEPARVRFNRPQAKPAIARLNRWDHIEEFDTTEDVTIDLTFICDSHDLGFLLTSLLGPDTYSSSTHNWLPGTLTGAETQPLLSMMVAQGAQDKSAPTWQVRKFKDCRVTNMPAPTFDPTTGTLRGRATLAAIYDGTATVGVPTYMGSGKAGMPFANAGVVFSRNNSVINPIIAGGLVFTNDARPLYGSPATAGSGALKPYRFTEGAQGGTADIVYDSGVDLDISFDNFEAGNIVKWAIVATADASNVLTITIPRIKYDTGEIDPSNDDTRQHVAGDWIYSTSEGSGVVVSLKGPRTTAYNS